MTEVVVVGIAARRTCRSPQLGSCRTTAGVPRVLRTKRAPELVPYGVLIATQYTDEVDGVRLRYDGLHITRPAGRWLAPWLLPQLARAAA